MKTSMVLLTALLGLTGWARAESVSIVQITDMHGQSEYEIQTHDQYTNLVKQVKDEVAIFPLVVAECKKEWEANKDNKLPFQGNRVKPRSAKKIGDFLDRAKAEKRLDQLEKRPDKPRDEKKSKSAKPKEEEVKKEEERTKAFDTAFEMITTKMGEKLKRPVENFGLSAFAPKKDGEKKDEPKKDEPKKDEPKKDEKKAVK